MLDEGLKMLLEFSYLVRYERNKKRVEVEGKK